MRMNWEKANGISPKGSRGRAVKNVGKCAASARYLRSNAFRCSGKSFEEAAVEVLLEEGESASGGGAVLARASLDKPSCFSLGIGDDEVGITRVLKVAERSMSSAFEVDRAR